MKFAVAIIVAAYASSLTPVLTPALTSALAQMRKADDDGEVLPVAPNPASDACASIAAFMIAPQVFMPGDEKDLPQWIQACNAHPDAKTCQDTVRLIVGNQRDVPPGLNCGVRL